jgi:hypothetical protein
VVVVATTGLGKGIWFRGRQGICGLRMRDGICVESASMLCELFSSYLRVMTRSERMPILIGEWSRREQTA